MCVCVCTCACACVCLSISCVYVYIFRINETIARLFTVVWVWDRVGMHVTCAILNLEIKTGHFCFLFFLSLPLEFGQRVVRHDCIRLQMRQICGKFRSENSCRNKTMWQSLEINFISKTRMTWWKKNSPCHKSEMQCNAYFVLHRRYDVSVTSFLLTNKCSTWCNENSNLPVWQTWQKRSHNVMHKVVAWIKVPYDELVCHLDKQCNLTGKDFRWFCAWQQIILELTK